jgi:hypothetical protein
MKNCYYYYYLNDFTSSNRMSYRLNYATSPFANKKFKKMTVTFFLNRQRKDLYIEEHKGKSTRRNPPSPEDKYIEVLKSKR